MALSHPMKIWVKVGGDHGGGSFKTMLQVANLPHANSRKNTFLLSIVNCKDTPQNLRKILNPYKKQIEDLQKMQWMEKRLGYSCLETMIFY